MAICPRRRGSCSLSTADGMEAWRAELGSNRPRIASRRRLRWSWHSMDASAVAELANWASGGGSQCRGAIPAVCRAAPARILMSSEKAALLEMAARGSGIGAWRPPSGSERSDSRNGGRNDCRYDCDHPSRDEHHCRQRMARSRSASSPSEYTSLTASMGSPGAPSTSSQVRRRDGGRSRGLRLPAA
jgi:hypothetical protein